MTHYHENIKTEDFFKQKSNTRKVTDIWANGSQLSFLLLYMTHDRTWRCYRINV